MDRLRLQLAALHSEKQSGCFFGTGPLLFSNRRCFEFAGAASPAHRFRPRETKKTSCTSRMDDGRSSKKMIEITTDSLNAKAIARIADANVQEKKNEESGSFEARLEAVKRAAQEAKKQEEQKMFAPIDYDAPVTEQDSTNFSFPVKVGVGLGVVCFGLIFAFGDMFPSGVVDVPKEDVRNALTAEEASKLKEQLKGFEAILKVHPDDVDALEGAAVMNAQLGEFSNSESELLRLIERKPSDVEALRLLGEVQNSLGKYDQSASSYRKALKVSQKPNIMLLKGLVEALVSQGKHNEAVDTLISAKNISNFSDNNPAAIDQSASEEDHTQLELLLGKTYAAWEGHMGDAMAVYDSIIKNYSNDFRGYLAKAVLLKQQGQKGEAERLLIQAQFLAPDRLKPLVDRYS